MKNNSGQKIKLTIQNTLIDLLLEQDFNKITVQNICKRGNIARSSFYNHYLDKFDLVNQVVKYYTDITEMVVIDNYAEHENIDFQQHLLASYQQIIKYHRILRALFTIHISPDCDFEANFREILARKYIEIVKKEGIVPTIPHELGCNLFVSNAMTLTKYIVCHPTEVDVHDFADFMQNLHKTTITQKSEH